jgi:hypothetical protein
MSVRAATREAEMDAEWITFSSLRTQFGISRSTGSRLIAARLIVAKKLGKRVLISAESVRQHLDRLPQPEIKLDDRAARLTAEGLEAA